MANITMEQDRQHHIWRGKLESPADVLFMPGFSSQVLVITAGGDPTVSQSIRTKKEIDDGDGNFQPDAQGPLTAARNDVLMKEQPTAIRIDQGAVDVLVHRDST